MFREWRLAIASSLFQVALIGFLGVFVFYIGGYFIGIIIWGITGNGYDGVVLAPIFSAILSYALYALGWFLKPRGQNQMALYKDFIWVTTTGCVSYLFPSSSTESNVDVFSAYA